MNNEPKKEQMESMDMDDEFKKSEVDNVFNMVTSLLQAAEKPDQNQSQPEIYGILTGLHVCDICGKEYANISNLNRHLKKIHKEDVLSVRAKIKCPLCDYGCEFYASLCKHLEDFHSIQIERETLVFETEDEFYEWKKKIEKLSKASFIKKCGRKKVKSNSLEKIYYYCHRSGDKLKRPTLGKRQMKAQGSCKMNSGCPAQITVVKHMGEKDAFPILEVEYLKTHVGHAMDMRHIRLDFEEKAKLASQLADGIPIDRVLDSVKKANELGGATERIHLTTRKDLLNISKQFQIRSKSVNWDQDIAGIDAWVRQVHLGNDSPILCYKPGGEVCADFPTLAAEDFLLGVMNNYQVQMLKKYGNNVICIDRTHFTNGFDFPLITVMIVDELFRAFPVVFLIANKQDETVMSVFFEQIKNKMGKIKPKVLMTDTGRVFYNSWKHVMGAVEDRLFCSWHVENVWLKKMQMIKDVEDQQCACKSLNILLNEPDPLAFQENLTSLLTDWQEDERFRRFAKYLQQNFVNSGPLWAASLRKGCSSKENLNLEILHKNIKDAYFEDCIKVKSMDKAIESIMKLLRHIEIERENRDDDSNVGLTKKLSMIIDRHERSLQIDLSNVILMENGNQPFYLVPSTAVSQMYLVQANSESCQCVLTCPQCNVCTHKFKCTCVDFSVKKNMCEHIHAVITKTQGQILPDTVTTAQVEPSVQEILLDQSGVEKGSGSPQIMMLAEDQDLLQIAAAAAGGGEATPIVCTDDLGSDTQDDQILIRVFSSGNVSSSSFSHEKKVLEDKAEQLLSKIKTCRSWDELNTIKNALIPLEPAIEMVVDDTGSNETVMVDATNLQTYIVTEKAC